MNNPKANGIWKAIARAMQMMTPVLAVVIAGMAVIYAGYSIYTLFIEHIQSGPGAAVLAVVTSVGVLVAVTAIALTSEHKPTRALASMFSVTWALIVLCMVSLSAALSSDLLVTFDALVGIGQTVAAGLAGLALIPALLIPASMQHPDTYKTTGAAAGHYWGLLGKATIIGTSSFATAYFGISRNVPLPVAVLCALLLETSFLWSYTQLIKARENRDRFDVGVWSAALVLFGVFIAMVSVETLSTLGGIDVPLLKPFQEVGSVLFVSAAGLSIALTVIAHLATTLIDMRAPVDASAPPINIFKPGTPAPQLNSEGPEMPQLTGGDVEKQLRDEMLAARARYEAHKTPAKVSESGQSYDATGTFVVPGEPPSIFGKEAGDPKS